jgi:hypothetical protein
MQKTSFLATHLELEDFLLSSPSPSELVLEYTSEAFRTFFFFFRPETTIKHLHTVQQTNHTPSM